MYRVSSLHLAAEHGHLLCLRALLDAGAACNTGTAEKRPYWVTTTTGTELVIVSLVTDSEIETGVFLESVRQGWLDIYCRCI